MKIPYGYALIDEEIIVNEEKADVVRSIFGYYLAGASLGKIVDMLTQRASFPHLVIRSGAEQQWTNSWLMQNIYHLICDYNQFMEQFFGSLAKY